MFHVLYEWTSAISLGYRHDLNSLDWKTNTLTEFGWAVI